jgi:preprotein translocase subunit YajC
MPDYLTLRKIYFLLTGPHRARTQRRQDMIAHSQKVAIVTGASGGIGAAVAKRLARDGFTVVVNYAGNAASADAVVARIEAAGAPPRPISLMSTRCAACSSPPRRPSAASTC